MLHLWKDLLDFSFESNYNPSRETIPLSFHSVYGGHMLRWKQSTIIIVLVLFMQTPGTAQWSDDISVNNPICIATERQEDPAICSDGDDGAIIAWGDRRSDVGNIFAQRIDRHGVVQWALNGIPICTTTQKQSVPRIISDGRGGAIITWSDERTGQYSGNIYAQRVAATGAMLWPLNGALVKSGLGYSPYITTDGAGGAIIAWRDDRTGVDAADIYAQHLDSTGAMLWPASGTAICTQSGQQMPVGIVSDDSGGAIIVWSHTRADGSPDIFARRVTAAGQAVWPASGVTIAALASWENYSRSMTDGNGGVVIAWKDNRSNDGYDRIYAQRVNRSGATQWTSNGKLLTAPSQFIMGNLEISPDFSGGGFLTYQSGAGYDSHLRMQRFNGAGTVLWDSNGVLYCGSVHDRHSQKVVPDGRGGVIATWTDGRVYDSLLFASRFNIYAEQLDSSGVVGWTHDGIALSDVQNNQMAPVLAPNSSGGAIIAWIDNRASASRLSDIYAMRVNANGTLTGVDDAPRIPIAFGLGRNYPNPFNPSTSIPYVLESAGFVTLKVYDLLGREVATLVNDFQLRGDHMASWDAGTCASGIYVCRLTSGMSTNTGKMILIR
jgi:hypothetical protein